MAYRHDPDLEFFQHLKDEELEELFNVLVYDKDGSERFTEELKRSDSYKTYGSNYTKYWQDIAAEVQCFGGNTFANMWRGGRGVVYKEVLCDVCDKLKVNYSEYASTEKIEQNLLMKILDDAVEKMDDEQRIELARSIGIKKVDRITPELLTAAFIKIFNMGGFRSYQITVIVVNAILKILLGRGLTIAGNAVLTRTMAILTGPVGWAITGLWTAVDIAGPAYRVTIPAVITIIGLRQQYINRDLLSDLDITDDLEIE